MGDSDNEADIIDINDGIDIYGDEDGYIINLREYSTVLKSNVENLHEAFLSQDQHKCRDVSHKFKGNLS